MLLLKINVSVNSVMKKYVNITFSHVKNAILLCRRRQK
jgi:hypothetical protein